MAANEPWPRPPSGSPQQTFPFLSPPPEGAGQRPLSSGRRLQPCVVALVITGQIPPMPVLLGAALRNQARVARPGVLEPVPVSYPPARVPLGLVPFLPHEPPHLPGATRPWSPAPCSGNLAGKPKADSFTGIWISREIPTFVVDKSGYRITVSTASIILCAISGPLRLTTGIEVTEPSLPSPFPPVLDVHIQEENGQCYNKYDGVNKK